MESDKIRGKIRVSGSYLILCDKDGKDLCFVGSRHLDDLETAIKISRHLAEIQSHEVREVILAVPPPQDEDRSF
jgi:hypothetical protein